MRAHNWTKYSASCPMSAKEKVRIPSVDLLVQCSLWLAFVTAVALCWGNTWLRWHAGDLPAACPAEGPGSLLQNSPLQPALAHGWTLLRKDRWKYFSCCCLCVWANAQIGDLGASLSAWALERDPSQSGYLGHAENHVSCSAPGTRTGLISVSERIGKWV